MERALGGELTHHLGYEKGDQAGRGSGNSRNGHSSKTVLTEDGNWICRSRVTGPARLSRFWCPRG